jgi:hypothetical protein
MKDPREKNYKEVLWELEEKSVESGDAHHLREPSIAYGTHFPTL